MTPAEVKVVVDLMQELGPDVSAAELQRLAKTSNVEMSINDVQTVVEIQEDIGGDKKLSNAEIQVSKFELENFLQAVFQDNLLVRLEWCSSGG